MNTTRIGHAVGAVDGRIIVAGGLVDYIFLSSAESLDPRDGVWRPLPSMDTKRGYSAFCVLNDRFVVAGGHNPTFLASVESFDVRANVWTHDISDMPKARVDCWGAVCRLPPAR